MPLNVKYLRSTDRAGLNCPAHGRRIRRLATFVAICLLLSIGSSAANAGLVTSMDAVSLATSADELGNSTLPPSEPLSPLELLSQESGRPSGLQSATPSSSTTGAPAGNSFSSSHSPAVLASDSCLPALTVAGWVTPESVLALPSLPRSGLFRPPCCML